MKYSKSDRANRLYKWFGDWFLNSQGRRSKAECMRRFEKADALKSNRQAYENEIGAEASRLLLEVGKL